MKNLSGAVAIARERIEQIEKHGRTVEWDVKNNALGQLQVAAQRLTEAGIEYWRADDLRAYSPSGWDEEIWLKMCRKPYWDRLIIAGALLAAAADRLKYIKENDVLEN